MQESAEKPQQKRGESRSRAQKMGKFRWLNYRMDRVEGRQKEIIHLLRVTVNSLEPFIELDKDELKSVVCKDEVDEMLLEHLRERGTKGITPSEAIDCKLLTYYRLKPYQVTRKIQAMNKRLKKWLDKDVAVSLHRRWILSRFVRKRLTESLAANNGDEQV